MCVHDVRAKSNAEVANQSPLPEVRPRRHTKHMQIDACLAEWDEEAVQLLFRLNNQRHRYAVTGARMTDGERLHHALQPTNGAGRDQMQNREPLSLVHSLRA